MSSSVYAQPLELSPGRSRLLQLYLLASHGGALALLLVLDISVIYRMLLVLLIVCSLAVLYRNQQLRLGRRVIHQVLWRPDGSWRLDIGGSVIEGAVLCPDTFVHPWLIVLRFAARRRGYTLVLLPDMLDPQTLRRLRVRLRHQARCGADKEK
ncbi:MAG: hypothetical protein HY940_04675 [Gammaproteobacteria bacterium]|nr:hypothetical protein [Gammaproteobacteria bacterium]